VTFADSVLHLVRGGARIDSRVGSSTAPVAEAPADFVVPSPLASETNSGAVESFAADFEPSALGVTADEQLDDLERMFEPGLADLESAVALVSSGLATRVVLSGFVSWPGLLWRAYKLADATGVLILPTVVRPGGKVDIVITRDTAANG